MDRLQGIVGDLVGVVAALGGAFFFVGFIANLAQAQVSTVTGDTSGRARALQQGVGMVLLLCVAASVGPLTASLARYFYGSGFAATAILTTPQGLFGFWTYLANLIVYTLVGVTTVILTVGAVYAGLGLQVAKMIGLPIGVAHAVGSLLAILMGLAIMVVSVALARGLLTLIFAHAR